MLSIIPYIILAFSISVPRARKAQVAAARLGVTGQDIHAALKRLENGTVAYEPSQEERDRWETLCEKAAIEQSREKARKKPKVMKTWGIALCAMGGVAGIGGIAELASGSSAQDGIGSTLPGMALFIGVGVFLILGAKKASTNIKE